MTFSVWKKGIKGCGMAATLAIAAWGLSSCGSSDSGNGGGSGSTSNLSGAFGTRCSSCHGSNGGGGSQRAIDNSSLSLAEWKTVVRNGRGNMSAVSASNYSDTDLEADYAKIKGN